jgi:hypothetical protein
LEFWDVCLESYVPVVARIVGYHVALFIGMLIALCELPSANAVE